MANEEEDEFFQYYRQYRPGLLNLTVGSSSRTSSEEVNNDSFSSSSSLSFKSAIGALLFPKRLKSRVKSSIRSRSEETGIAAASAKLAFQQFAYGPDTSKYLPNLNENPDIYSVDGSQSRDSGNSSGGTPEFRRRRRLKPPKPNLKLSEYIKKYECGFDTPSKSKNVDPSSPLLKIERSFFSKIFYSLLTVFFILFCLIGLNMGFCEFNSNRTVESSSVISFLQSHLFGQELALNIIEEALENIKIGQTSVLYFIGSVGVGKTFTVTLLEDQFPVPLNVHSYISPFDVSELRDLSLLISRSCGPSLIIFQDLDSNNDSEITEAVQSFILSSALSPNRNKNGNLLVLTTSEGSNEINKLAISASKSNSELTSRIITKALESQNLSIPALNYMKNHLIQTKIVPFLPLNRTSLKACILKEFEVKGLAGPTKEELNYIIRSNKFFTKDYPVFASSGCKNIKEMVALLV